LNVSSPTSDTSPVGYIYDFSAYVIGMIRLAAVIGKNLEDRSEEVLLKGVDEGREQYKLGKGKRITRDEELDAFIDRL
jgi:hypothetical protein